MLQWFAVYTRIRCERRAERGFREHGLETFLPTYRRWYLRPTLDPHRPLFPRYVFLGVPAGHWPDDVDGAIQVLPTPIPAAVMAPLFLADASGVWDQLAAPEPKSTKRRRRRQASKIKRVAS